MLISYITKIQKPLLLKPHSSLQYTYRSEEHEHQTSVKESMGATWGSVGGLGISVIGSDLSSGSRSGIDSTSDTNTSTCRVEMSGKKQTFDWLTGSRTSKELKMRKQWIDYSSSFCFTLDVFQYKARLNPNWLTVQVLLVYLRLARGDGVRLSRGSTLSKTRKLRKNIGITLLY